jgi:23S rRNA pseudouridine2604 synthase
MGQGVPILGTKTRRCDVRQIDAFTFRIVLTQGLNRQIRRMCEFFDYRVATLKRIRIMNIKLDLPVGQWRELNEDEIIVIKSMVADSIKDFDEHAYE